MLSFSNITRQTKDGKALGRWINNQRSAKHKGSLKKERDLKLVSTGLKWSVLSTNSWQDMMNELKQYVREKTKDGQPWDGNVPTNYKIKGSAGENGGDGEDDKNLGRWINRQRSLYQSGRLRKDRQVVSFFLICLCPFLFAHSNDLFLYPGIGKHWPQMVRPIHNILAIHVRHARQIRQ